MKFVFTNEADKEDAKLSIRFGNTEVEFDPKTLETKLEYEFGAKLIYSITKPGFIDVNNKEYEVIEETDQAKNDVKIDALVVKSNVGEKTSKIILLHFNYFLCSTFWKFQAFPEKLK